MHWASGGQGGQSGACLCNLFCEGKPEPLSPSVPCSGLVFGEVVDSLPAFVHGGSPRKVREGESEAFTDCY